jgi:signal transduction histidine kinase
MPKATTRFRLPSILAGFWLAFSVSLAGWWLIFGLQQIDRLKEFQHSEANELVRQQRMVMWEGSFLIVCLLGGGSALLYYIHKESRRNLQIKEFFATFTHELKTSLASLRLQTESLEEDLRGSGGPERLLARLVNDTVRLELQLENSLFLAHADQSRMILETVSLKRAIESVQRHWPNLQVQLNHDAKIRADETALESVLKNLMQNSIVHGLATEIQVKVESRGPSIIVQMTDNGRGFHGDIKALGRIFQRHYTKSGSGVGLYLAGELMRKMGGSLVFKKSDQNGFAVLLKFHGENA